MIDAADVRAARARLAGIIAETPCPYSETLSAMTGARVFVKLENLQMTGSFKERGAANLLLQLSPDERRRGVVAASAGNHGTGRRLPRGASSASPRSSSCPSGRRWPR